MELAVTLATDLVNTVVGDLYLENGDIVLHNTLAKEVAQRLTVRLNFFRGEWFLDTREGTPYYQAILEKGVTDRTIRSVFSQVIAGTEGVSALESFSYEWDKRTRELSLTFRCRLEDGTTFSTSSFAPFVVVY